MVTLQGVAENMNGYTSPLGISSFTDIELGLGDFCYNLIERRSVVAFQAFKYFVHLLKISNDRNDFHFASTFWVYQRVHFVHLLD